MTRIFYKIALTGIAAAVGFGGLNTAFASDAPATLSVAMAEEAPKEQPAQPIEITAEQQKQVDELATAYLEIHKQLAQDKLDDVAAQIEIVHERGHELAETDNERLKKLADAVGKAAHLEADQLQDLEATREAFKKVSEATILLLEVAKPGDKAAPALRVVRCPMAEADWLQVKKVVANPYFGQAMSRCGSITKTIKDGDDHEGHQH